MEEAEEEKEEEVYFALWGLSLSTLSVNSWKVCLASLSASSNAAFFLALASAQEMLDVDVVVVVVVVFPPSAFP